MLTFKKKQLSSMIAALLAVALLLSGCSHDPAPDETDASAGTVSSDQGTYSLKVGDVMPDFTVTTTEGESLTLSDVAKEKKLVVLNFWFASCSWCRKEFPVMEEAYQKYKDDVAIIALNPIDSKADAAAFQEDHSLSFPMATCPMSMAEALGVPGYPTSVFIDREGVICLIHAGAVTDVQVFNDAFETFVSDDYERRLYDSISELVR